MIIAATSVPNTYPTPQGVTNESVETIAQQRDLEILIESTRLLVAQLEVEPVVDTTDYIIQAIHETFPEAPIMVQVARCESALNPLADRENRNVDVGLFQINQVHGARLNELGLDRRNLYDNLEFSRMLFNESGLDPWYMSQHCWGPYLG